MRASPAEHRLRHPPARVIAGAALTLLLAIVLGLTVGGRLASAQVFLYCGVNVNPGTWCGNNSVNHSYDGQHNFVNAAPGGVCERMLNDRTRAVRSPGPTCSPPGSTQWKFCYARAGGTDFQYQAEASHRTSRKATVSGNAYYGTRSPTIC